jgi:hypothetical protein
MLIHENTWITLDAAWLVYLHIMSHRDRYGTCITKYMICITSSVFNLNILWCIHHNFLTSFCTTKTFSPIIHGTQIIHHTMMLLNLKRVKWLMKKHRKLLKLPPLIISNITCPNNFTKMHYQKYSLYSTIFSPLQWYTRKTINSNWASIYSFSS